MIERIGLHLILSHHVPAWMLALVVLLFVSVETLRILFGHRTDMAQAEWLAHAGKQLDASISAQKTLQSTIDVLGKAVESLAIGGEEHT